jgi:ribosomal protein S27AE
MADRCPECGLVGDHKLDCSHREGRGLTVPVFVCPRCGAISAHPTDIAQGYCGRCHDWTR